LLVVPLLRSCAGIVLVILGVLVVGPPEALASLPVYEGLTTFPTIYSSAEPEEFSWEVTLYEEQELQQIDEQEIGVYYNSGPRAFVIQAGAAHDADGATVPTTIQATGANTFTLTVHHREGNPAAGGAPFVYPVSYGPGWEGGFVPVVTTIIEMPPGEKELREGEEKRCRVPALRGATVAGARRRLRRAYCRLGAITKARGVTKKTGRVVHQSEPAGSSRAHGARVGIKLGSGGGSLP
jgi:hypothetical protein